MGSCYFGTSTRANKLSWGFFILFVLIGAGLWVPGFMATRKCLAKYRTCDDYQMDRNQTAARMKVLSCVSGYKQCIMVPAILWSLGWLFLVLSCIPCFYFCCCSKSPHTEEPQSAPSYAAPAAPQPGHYQHGAAVQMAGYPQPPQQQYAPGPYPTAQPAYPPGPYGGYPQQGPPGYGPPPGYQGGYAGYAPGPQMGPPQGSFGTPFVQQGPPQQQYGGQPGYH